ncbi:MAG: hypothetical protein KME30_18720 [Iphinoe sp. HA4291-MV1]|jgi:hypothetical protein|nr:hypothetical protein [Iphinoe sp. HA4291-MV1]
MSDSGIALCNFYLKIAENPPQYKMTISGKKSDAKNNAVINQQVAN